jgi:hypothetical protein
MSPLKILKHCPLHFGELKSFRTIKCIEMKLNCTACAEFYIYCRGYTSIGYIPRTPIQQLISHQRYRIDKR